MKSLDRVSVTGITGHGYHGVLPSEREAGQPFIVDITMHLDTAPAAASDELARTVDYSVVAAAVLGLIQGPAFDLIETLADRIATTVLQQPLVALVEVTVHKPQAPVGVPFGDVTVAITRERGGEQ